MATPSHPGWYWFLPDERCSTPTGLLRLDRPVVLLVVEHIEPFKFLVRFPGVTMFTDIMSGDWEPIEAPERMTAEVKKRIQQKKTH